MRPLILISNDDGFYAEGIKALTEIVKELGDVVVVAPDGGRSGASLSITSTVPVRYRKEYSMDGVTVYSCTGSPCDCIKMAFEKILDRRPDIVLGGINHGDNAAVNAHYSGTLAISLESTIKGVPAIGFSSCALSGYERFLQCREPIYKIVKSVIAEGLPAGVYLNVNIPDCDTYSGIRLCKMGKGDWIDEWIEREHPRGGTYYWIAGHYESFDSDDDSTDTWALNHGYVAITPITLDLTAYSAFDRLRRQLDI